MSRFANLLLLAIAAQVVRAGTVTVIADPQVIGDKLLFQAESVQVTTGAGTLTIDIRTNFQNPNLYAFVDTGVRLDIGDLFFTIDGTYAYGIPLEYHNGPAGGPWGDRLYAGHVYEIDDPALALLTSDQALHDPQYFDYRPGTVVWMMDRGVRDVTVGRPSVQVLPTGKDGSDGPLYDIHVQTGAIRFAR